MDGLQAYSQTIPFTLPKPKSDILKPEWKLAIDILANKRPDRPTKETHPYLSHHMSDAVWNIVQKCWNPQREERPSIEEVKIVLETELAKKASSDSTSPPSSEQS